MSALGHVWTAPWQELSDGLQLVGCGHVSGLLVRQVWPLALMLCAERVPIESPHLEVRRPKRALPIPGTTVAALRGHALANWAKCWWKWSALGTTSVGATAKSP